MALQHTATHCKTLQHISTFANLARHNHGTAATATHYNTLGFLPVRILAAHCYLFFNL